jgi:hypothetical protein
MILTLHKMCYGDHGIDGRDMQQEWREMRNESVTAGTEPSVNGDSGAEVMLIL